MKRILQNLYNVSPLTIVINAVILLLMLCSVTCLFAQKTTVSSGNFSDPSIWNTPGLPSTNDLVTITAGHIIEMDSVARIKNLTIQDGAKLVIENNHKLEVTDGIILNGRMDVNDGDLTLLNVGATFKTGANGYFLWAPANNTASGTSIFLNGIEDFSPTSTINIEKWFNYSNTPIGSVVSGNFGNLILNSISNGLIFEWNQQNYFEQHIILGTLTIGQGWIVLDKSGLIQNTFINSIELSNINSYFDFHSGNHPGTFIVKTNGIKNTGGTFNGIVNGNGNIRLEVTGDFNNHGNVCLIYNSGVINTANGDSYLKLTGKYTQAHGDFRGIFNISSTTSGKSEIELGEAEITGGIFMVNYGCHTANKTSKLKINGNLILNNSSSNGKFRGNGLTTLSGTQNNLKLQLTIGGNCIVNGANDFEFISSGSSGSEIITITGDAQFNNGNIYFNMGDHLTELLIEKTMFVNGGTIFLSKTNGTLSAFVNNSIQVNAGNLNIKGNAGNANLTVLGDFSQTGGTVTFHNNVNEATSNIVYASIQGKFNSYSGSFLFDNNSSSTVNHKLSLNGNSFSLGGNARFNSTNTRPGIIYYDYVGEMMYNASGTAIQIQNTKQIISAQCVLKVNTGNMQVASSVTEIKDWLTVSDDATLDLGDKQVYSNGLSSYSGIYVDEDGRIRISSKKGLYDGTANGSINAAGNMNYYLHNNSIVEYYGEEIQVITGNGIGAAQTEEQKYGILEINKTNGKSLLKASDVEIRTGLYLNKGEFDLNGYNVTITSGKPFAITRTAGYIRSEAENPSQGGQVKWRNIEAGYHIVPFGIAEDKMLPFTFTPNNGLGREFAVSTKRSVKENRPLPSGVTNLNINGTDGGNNKIIDRWYFVKASGVTAGITLSYLPEENTTQAGISTGNFSVMSWSFPAWKLLGGSGDGNTTTNGIVELNNNGVWGNLILASHEAPLPADILAFEANLVVKQVNLNWTAKANILAEKYIIERSSDEINYVAILEQQAMPHNSTNQKYSTIDYNPLRGVSYYRLKQVNPDGTTKYSNLETITIDGSSNQGIEVVTIGPNPFTDYFTVTFNTSVDSEVEIALSTLTGQKIQSESINAIQGRNSYTFQATDKTITGIYLLTISDGKSKITQKLFKK